MTQYNQLEWANSIQETELYRFNAVLVFSNDIPINAAILIFLYVMYFNIKKTMVNFIF